MIMTKIKSYDKALNKFVDFVYPDIRKYVFPINFREEKEKFFKIARYEPQFKYTAPSLEKIKKARASLLTIEKDSSPLGSLYGRKKEELELVAKSLSYLGQKKLFSFADQIYQKPSTALVREAYQEWSTREKTTPSSKSSRITVFEAQEKIKQVLLEHKIPWKTKISEKIISRGVVSYFKQILYLEKGTFFKDAKDLEGFIAHEVFGHIFRFENGRRQPYGIFMIGFPGYLATEEGLASYNRLVCLDDVRKNELRNNIALRVIAFDIAQKKSFRQTFLDLLDLTGKRSVSFGVTLRIKRGLCDTKQKGAFSKDTTYFRGLREVEDYLKKEDIATLYSGRVSLDGLATVASLPDLKKPYHLPYEKKA